MIMSQRFFAFFSFTTRTTGRLEKRTA